jgi:hypothetical protein
MDYALTDDQSALVSAVQAVLKDHSYLPQSAKYGYCYFDAKLQATLVECGFLDAARDMGPLEAALVVVEASRIAATVETGASALVAPLVIPDEKIEGPIALVDGRALMKAHRNLSIAKTALIDMGHEVVVLQITQGDAVTVESILGYPYGKFCEMPKLDAARHLGPAAAIALRQWWRVALAAEFAGAAQSAVAFTIDYVKQREVFGRAIGSLQAVQHRLAQCHQIAAGIYWLALKAAWSGEAQDADLAACYAQQHVQKILFDLHQFNGAMGVTNEHLLHFWTYRLRALQAEAGGAFGSSMDIADKLWGSAKVASTQ